jgi:hypothetical protein
MALMILHVPGDQKYHSVKADVRGFRFRQGLDVVQAHHMGLKA